MQVAIVENIRGKRWAQIELPADFDDDDDVAIIRLLRSAADSIEARRDQEMKELEWLYEDGDTEVE